MYLTVHVWELKFMHHNPISTSALLKNPHWLNSPVSFCYHFVLKLSQPGPFAYDVYQKLKWPEYMILGSSFEILITHNNLHFHNQINDIEDGFITKVIGER